MRRNNSLENRVRPTLLILTSSYPNGPKDETCGYIREFARSLSSEFAVKVLAPADRNARGRIQEPFTLARSRPPLPKSLDPFQATTDFNSLPSRGFATKFAMAISFAAFCKEALTLARDADAICSHWMIPSGLVGALLSRLLGKPHLVVEHSGALRMVARMRIGARLARFIIAGSDRIVTVSHELKRKLIELCPAAENKVDVIRMGIREPGESKSEDWSSQSAGAGISESDSSSLSHRNEKRQNVLFIGRLTAIKGADALIKAMTIIKHARLVIAGDGEQRGSLEELARTLKADVEFIGRVEADRRDNLLSTCDAVVIPSLVLADGRTEGTPVVCLEAMAAGKPVIASRVGGLAEIIIDGHNGLLFEPGDHMMLAEKLNLILQEPDLGKMLSRNARLTVAGFSWSQTGERFAKIIKGLLENDSIHYGQSKRTRNASC